MKRFLILLLLFVFMSPAIASDWKAIFTSQEVDFDSIEHDNKTGIIKFFVKKYKDNPTDTFVGKDYNYIIYRMALNCPARKCRIEMLNIYGYNNEVVDSDEHIGEWSVLVPDTYAEGYYKTFCSIPFNQNPLLKK